MPYKDKSKDTARLRKWRADNPEKAKAHQKKYRAKTPDINRKRYLKERYDLSLEDYEKMWDAQGGKCAICGHPPKAGKRLVVDHHHGSGKVRALLCDSCNLMIGNAREDVSILSAGISYLEDHR